MKSEYVLIHAAPIKHYGIKGQKKGVRRFQLDNGELTAAGKARYGVGTSGNRPYSTPYSEPQDTASGRKKNVTGTTSGATANKSKSYKQISVSKLGVSTNPTKDHPYGEAGVHTSRYYDLLIQKGKGTLTDANKKTLAAYNRSAGASNKQVKLAVAGINNSHTSQKEHEKKATELRRKVGRETWDASGTDGGHYENRDKLPEKSREVSKSKGPDLRVKTKADSAINAATSVAKKKATLEERAPEATMLAKAQGTALKAHNAVRSTTQNKAGNSGTNKQLASPAKVDKDKLSSRGNEKTRDNVTKVGADLADIASDRAKQMDNGAIDTFKKKDLVKIKSGKNTRR